ncbi:MAG: hypothetical protein ABID54_10720 [Pseudomonadota bacterium]
MVLNDKPKLQEILDNKATLVGRVIEKADVDAYFDYLQAFPLDLIDKAATQALRDRDPEDVFLKTQMVTAIEIEQAASRIIEVRSEAESGKCPMCGNSRWIAENVRMKIKTKDGTEKEIEKLVAHPCECLYKMAADILRHKSRSHKDRENDHFRDTVIKSYEAYQKR